MLILTRKPNQTVRIGSDIRVTILGIRGAYIRIGITAPRHVAVNREEIVHPSSLIGTLNTAAALAPQTASPQQTLPPAA